MEQKEITEQHKTVFTTPESDAACPSDVFMSGVRALSGFCSDPALQCPAAATQGIALLSLAFIECTIWNYLLVTTGFFVLL